MANSIPKPEYLQDGPETSSSIDPLADPVPLSLRKQDDLGLLKQAAKGAFLAGAPALKQIEERIRSQLGSNAPSLTEISRYLLDLGGKRIRPLIAVLSAQLFGMEEPSDELIDAAAGIELIHMATLLHDDIIDQSPKRRNQISAFSKYGMAPTLLTGDFLLTRSFGLCAHLDEVIVEATEKACVELSEGELLEGILDSERRLSLEEYIYIVSHKTASLFVLSAIVGSHLARTDEENLRHMAEFGRLAGVAFQMVDDILDVTADEDLLGKPSGTDLRQKTPSLVNILWLQTGDRKALDFFNQDKPSVESCKDALKFLRSSSVLDKSRQLAEDCAVQASRSLKKAAVNSPKPLAEEYLLALVRYTLERCM